MTGRAWGATGLTVRYPAGGGGHDPVIALRDVSVTVGSGQTLGLIGGDGAGKSTLLRALAGERLDLDGELAIPPADRIGFVPSAGGLYPDLTVAENLAFVAAACGLRRWRRRADALLERAELHQFPDRLGGALSGGQQRKLAASMALLPQPDLLLLDEVTTGVDPVSRMAIWKILSGAAAEGAAVVVATGYVDEAERMTDVLLLHNGVTLAAGSPGTVEAAATGHVYERPEPTDRATAWRHGTHWRQWSAAPIEDATPISPGLEDASIVLELAAGEQESGAGPVPAPAPRPGHGTGPTRRGGGDPVLRVDAVSHHYGDFVAVDRVGLEVGPGEIVGLIGANGAGKTTLIKMVLGLLPVTSGSISVFGGPIVRHTLRSIGYVPQDLGLYPDLTVQENLSFRAVAYGVPPVRPTGEIAADGPRLIGQVPLGIQRQVAFAGATQAHPRLLVLDEPTSGVSPLGRSRLWDVIHEQADRAVAVLVSTHYMSEADQADRIVMLAGGRQVAHGSVEQVIDGRTVAVVTAGDWAAAFAALDRPDRFMRLDGRSIRIVTGDVDRVRADLAAAGIDARVATAPATLDEVMADVSKQDVRGDGGSNR
ncbi:MAG: ATP-binding cassette domain-containing protein [Acidimicrobiales bacterium]